MSDFNAALAHVLKWEGGYSDDPRDPGGETNFGISKRFHPNVDIKNLTHDQAAAIYRREYWDTIGGDKLPNGLALAAFDTAVNVGVSKTKSWLALSFDIGDLLAARMLHYAGLDKFQTYGKGWTRRVLDTYKAALIADGKAPA